VFASRNIATASQPWHAVLLAGLPLFQKVGFHAEIGERGEGVRAGAYSLFGKEGETAGGRCTAAGWR
jgi:hypothetical protein